MLPEIGASELLIIAAVALIVVGPKDLPLLMRRVGQFMARVRGMAAEFRQSFDDMARQSELDDLRKEVEAMRRGQLSELSITDGAMNEAVSDIQNSMSDVGVQLHPPMSYQYAQTSEPPELEPEPGPDYAPAAPPAEPPKPRPRRPAKPKAASASNAAAGEATASEAPAKPRARKAAAKKSAE